MRSLLKILITLKTFVNTTFLRFRRAVATPISLALLFFLSLILCNEAGPSLYLYITASKLTAWPPLLFCLLSVLGLAWCHDLRYLEADLTSVTSSQVTLASHWSTLIILSSYWSAASHRDLAPGLAALHHSPGAAGGLALLPVLKAGLLQHDVPADHPPPRGPHTGGGLLCDSQGTEKLSQDCGE